MKYVYFNVKMSLYRECKINKRQTSKLNKSKLIFTDIANEVAEAQCSVYLLFIYSQI